MEEFLIDYIETNLFLELDDQSEVKIASLIIQLLGDLSNDSTKVLEEFVAMAKQLNPESLYFVNKNKETKMEEEFEENIKVKDPEFDEDGF